MCCFFRPHCHGGFMMPNMFYHTPMYMMPHHHCGPKNFGQGFGMGLGMSLGFGLGNMFNCWF